MIWRRLFAIAPFFALTTAAAALDARFAGNWRIDSVTPAPWAGPGDIDPKEAQGLLGKRVTFGAKTVSAPNPLGCKGARYSVRDADGPETLFEGMLASPDKSGKPRDAAALAHSLGMTTPTVTTLDVGCSEIAFHAFTPETLVFALDNQIYTLKRAR